MAKGVSSPRALAIPMAMAVFPVPGWPARRTARPAILPSRIMERMTPAACVEGGGGEGEGAAGRGRGSEGRGGGGGRGWFEEIPCAGGARVYEVQLCQK